MHTNIGMIEMRELKKQMNEMKAGIQRSKMKEAKRTTVQEKSNGDVCRKMQGEDEHADQCFY